MGPFARAVTAAIEHDSDCGRFPEVLQRTYVESRCAANGPEWRDFLNNTQSLQNGWTPLARMRQERAK